MNGAPLRLTLDAWKEKATAGEVEPSILLKGSLDSHVKAEGGGKYTFTISTASVDRDRDTLAVEGWDLENYKKNPVVLFAHNSGDLPIGRAETVNVSGASLKSRVVFTSMEENPKGEQVRRLVDGGFLRATSVGFLPKSWVFDQDRGGFDFKTQELYEFSIVPIPANPEALLDAKAAGIDIAFALKWAEGVLDANEPGIWVPKAAAVHALMKAPTVSVPALWTPDPAIATVKAALTKRGRTLSAANESKLRAARDASDAVALSIDAVLAQLDEPEDDKSKAVLTLLPATEPRFHINPKDLSSAVATAVSGAVGAAIRQHTGRLPD